MLLSMLEKKSPAEAGLIDDEDQRAYPRPPTLISGESHEPDAMGDRDLLQPVVCCIELSRPENPIPARLVELDG